MKSRLLLASLSVLAALLIGFVGGFILPRFLPAKPPGTFLNTSSVVRQVQTLSELVTVKYVIEKVIGMSDVNFFGEDRVLLIAHGVVKAGVRLDGLKAEDVRVSDGGEVTVHLPKASILDVYLDEFLALVDPIDNPIRAEDDFPPVWIHEFRHYAPAVGHHVKRFG